MKKSNSKDLSLAVAAIATLVVTCAALFATASDSTSREVERPVESGKSSMPSLRGAEAVKHLQANGQYDSLVDAMKAVTERDGASRPETSNGAFSLQKRVLASSPQFFSFFGESVAISGSTAIVGALNQSVNGNSYQGAAYVFVRSGATWVEQDVLVASDGAANDRFGYSVAIDGERAIVGAAGDNVGSISDQGSAYVFLRSGTVWNEEAKLTGDPNGGDEFGSSVAISGLTAVVGSNYLRKGAAYVFVRGTIWTLQQRLVASGGAEGDAFGFQRAVAISGETIIVGSRFATVGSNLSQGAAYIYTRSGSTWTAQQKLTAPDGVPYAEFGLSVAINGETAVVGAWRDTIGGVTKGSAYVFVRNGIFWLLQQKLTPSDAQDGDRFGRSVGIEGETLIVGLEPSVFLSSRPGSAYIFVRSGNNWTEEQKLSAPNVTFSDRFGSSVAIDGATVVVGAVYDSVTQSNQGSAYIFGSAGSAVVAPEGIAFSSNRDGNDEIYVMNPDGSGQTRLTDDPESDLHPSFSGDQSFITFSSTRDGNAEIYVMNADDGSSVTRLTNNSASDTQPSFSRDGLRIAFRSNRDGNDEIYVMNADGSNQTRITNNNLSDSDPSFSPSGTRVLFERVGADNNRDIFTMNANGSSQTRLTTASGDDRSASFSRDGSRIGFASARNGNSQIYVMNADGNNQARLTNNSFSDIEPSFSPDDTSLAFVSDRDGNSEIYAMNADGSNQSRLTNNSALDSAPDWGGYVSRRIFAGDGTQNAFFGYSVAISGDTAIVGAYGAIVGANSQGAAYVFVRVGGAWIQQQKLVAADGSSNDFFGISVAISGETAIVGARFDAPGGSAYVFVRNGTTWTQQQKLSTASGESFGWSVAIDGETTVVGAVGADSNRGAAYVFVRNGTAWTQQQQLTAADGSVNAFFGLSVAISGQTAIVGAPSASVGGNITQGAAYVFVRNGTAWTQEQKLTAADGAAQDNFGSAVGISGESAIVSSPRDDVGANPDQGSAYTFVRSGTTWTQQQQLTAADGVANDTFGSSVAISGETAIVGAEREHSSGANNKGAAYTFTRSGSVWTQLQKVVAPDAAAGDFFGRAAGISGETAIVGAPSKSIVNIGQGAAYIFATVLPPPPTPTPPPTPVPTVQPNTPVGVPVTVRIYDAAVTFPSVTQAGNTIFAEINPPTSAGTPPAGYLICPTCTAYDITTTAVYTGPVNVCLGVPSGIGEPAFSTMILLHGEGGVLVDRTTGRFTSGDGDRTVCGSVTSLSPFVLAQASGTPTPTPAGLEADVAGRPSGDGSFSSNDVVQLRRFASGLDTPATSPNEFQRADSAPIASKGDGAISSADVVQARRFVAGLDAPGSAGGPTSPGAFPALRDKVDDLYGFYAERELTLGEAEFETVSTISLPVEIIAYGDEAAVSFTLEYNSEALSNPRIVLGDAFADGAVLTVNKSLAGRIGVLIDSDLPMIAAQNARRIVIMTFDIASHVKDPAFWLSDNLAGRSVSDSFGNELQMRWLNSSKCENLDSERSYASGRRDIGTSACL